MEFCEDCNNMLYLKIIKTEDSESKLEYNCKNCNYSCDNSNKDSCVFSTNYNMDNIKKESKPIVPTAHCPLLGEGNQK